MAATTSVQEASKALKCQTWVLKVSIHCQGCSKKVRKVLQRIDGVYTTSIDSQQQRVTVTGIIGAETLIRKLVKSGKHAEMWPAKVDKKDKESSIAKNMHQPKDVPESAQSNTHVGSGKSVKFRAEGQGEETKNVESPPSPGNSTGREDFPGGNNKGRGSASGGKKKKTKGQAGKNGSNAMGSGSSTSGTSATAGYQAHGGGLDQVAGSSNLSPTRQHSIPWPQGYFIPQAYASSGYSMAYPSEGNRVPFYYYVPSYTRANAHQTTPSDSFYIFSDENVNGCSVM